MARSGFVIDTFWCPKEGNTSEDYEDASSIVQGPEGCRVAIADGATESSFSKLWASLLVDHFTKSSEEGPEFFYDLGSPREEWKDHVGQRQLPWYAEEKAGMGAFAAVLGFTADYWSRRWVAVAVGDCCLFQLDFGPRGARLVESFPLTKSEEFGFSPYLLGTTPESSENFDKSIRMQSGTMQVPDDFKKKLQDRIQRARTRR